MHHKQEYTGNQIRDIVLILSPCPHSNIEKITVTASRPLHHTEFQVQGIRLAECDEIRTSWIVNFAPYFSYSGYFCELYFFYSSSKKEYTKLQFDIEYNIDAPTFKPQIWNVDGETNSMNIRIE